MSKLIYAWYQKAQINFYTREPRKVLDVLNYAAEYGDVWVKVLGTDRNELDHAYALAQGESQHDDD